MRTRWKLPPPMFARPHTKHNKHDAQTAMHTLPPHGLTNTLAHACLHTRACRWATACL